MEVRESQREKEVTVRLLIGGNKRKKEREMQSENIGWKCK